MSTATITSVAPIEGPAYDKNRPETRQPWIDFRNGGITATQIRDWGQPAKRRQIIQDKLSGTSEDISHLPYVDHGNRREPVIAEWAQGKFGITPCESVYAHGENPRHLASPDGISRDPFTGELIIGEHGALVMEVKTSKYDLTPGPMDAAHILIEMAHGTKFENSGYYVQIQWQMYVMQSPMTLFVYEQHDDIVDPVTKTFTPIGPPQWTFIPRDQALINILVDKVAPLALAEIDAARTALIAGDLPPVSDLPAEDMVLVQDLLKGRDAESTAKTSKEAAWKALTSKYVGPGKPDMSLDVGIAQFTVATSNPLPSSREETYFDEEAAMKAAPKKLADLRAFEAKYTKTRVVTTQAEPSQRLTITAKKVASA